MSDALDELRRRLFYAGLDERRFCELCGASRWTFRRWAEDGLPTYAETILEMYSGALPWPDWSGWRICGPNIYPPGDARPLSNEDIQRDHFTRYQLQHYQEAVEGHGQMSLCGLRCPVR